MRNKAYSILLFAAILSILLPAGIARAFSGSGSGTEQDPYIMTDVNQLQEMNDHLSAWHELGDNIDASATSGWNGGAGFAPIGTGNPYGDEKFTGHFDGRGHTITGLYINRPDSDYVGLFGCAPGNEVKDVGLVGVNITGATYVGGLIGHTGSGVSRTRCYVTGTVRGREYVGGLIGLNWGTDITDCYSIANVSGDRCVGGLVGFNMGESGDTSIVSCCYSAGLVNAGVSGEDVGGLVGHSMQTDWNSCYWDIETSGQTTSAGGVGKTTAEMKWQVTFTFTPYAWDFEGVWNIEEDVTYPFLRVFEDDPQAPPPSQIVGSGNPEDPYIITNVKELQAANNHLSARYELGNDIDASATSGWHGGAGFIPIGSGSPYGDNAFRGHFDGKGHTITSLHINRPNSDYVGLFGCAPCNEIKDVGLINVDITGRDYVGGLIGHTGSGVSRTRCYTRGKVDAREYVGGLIGLNWRTDITDCYSTASVSGDSTIGGLIGFACGYSGGTSTYVKISRCYSAGLVNDGVSGDYIGGLVGHSMQTDWNSCYWDIETSGQETSAGGLGKTTMEMKWQVTYTFASYPWDFDTVWDIVEGVTYPFLRGVGPPLLAPTGLEAKCVSESTIALTWNAVPDAAGYRLERKEGTSEDWSVTATLGAGVMAYADTGLSSQTTYYYRLAAYHDLALSLYSRIVSANPLLATWPWTTRVEPAAPEPLPIKQSLIIHGFNLKPATVRLEDLTRGNTYSNLSILSHEPDRIEINVGLGSEPGWWAIVVTGPDEKHSEHYFDVGVKLVSDDVTKPTHISINRDYFVRELTQAGFITARMQLRQIVGLDETRNYTWADKGIVGGYETVVTFNKSQQEYGVKQLLAFLQNDPHLDLSKDQHIRWAAYMLATAYKETAFTWNAVQENYDSPAWEYFEDKYGGRLDLGNTEEGDGFRYRGRGYAQLTGKELYTRFGEAFGMSFAHNPNQVLDPVIAYTAMSYGMRHGLYTQKLKGLPDYISSGDGLNEEQKRQEYINARLIVNPLDNQPELIADYAMQLELILRNTRIENGSFGPRYYVENGSYTGGSLGGWAIVGSGTVDTLRGEGNNYWARVTTASPVVLSQAVSTPAVPFRLSFNYQFLTTSGSLAVMLNSVVVATLAAPDVPQAEPETFSILVNDADLLGREGVVLALRIDGPTGSQVLLGSVIIYGLYPVGDLNYDGRVGTPDFVPFASEWLRQDCVEPAWCDGADLNKSGSVDLFDLAEFAEHWLEGSK